MKKIKGKKEIKKNGSLYIWILIVWGTLSAFGLVAFINTILQNRAMHVSVWTIILLIVNTIFILYFWLNGTKDIVYIFFYQFKYKKMQRQELKVLETELLPKYKDARVLLLYCTCNDFIEESLFASMNQKYSNYKTVILDDSSENQYKERIDNFAQLHSIEVIRRENRKGYKAGNLNNYLVGREDYDFFVILDSDEIIPEHFIAKALQYFSYYPEVGLLQANHISTRNRTKFMERFSVGVDAHWPTYQAMKERYGFMSFLGHGAMISKECFESVERFPHLVAEDLCFSIEAKIKGYFTAFSTFIVCEEEYPVDYFAFKKRHLKWTGGNLEFISNYAKKLFYSKNLRWFEKLDVVLFTFSLPMSTVFFLFLIINLILLPLLGVSAGYPLWLMTPTIIFLYAPTINDMVYLLGRYPFFKSIGYLFSAFLLYGSLYWISFYGATKAWIGIKPKFIVTPKENRQYSLVEIINGNIQEILFSLGLMVLSVWFTKSLLPVILIVLPSLSGIYLTSLCKEKRLDKNTGDKKEENRSMNTEEFEEGIG
ncbi:glycosyltransferase [Enterococcus sp. AZ072]|uniref:glycosyltransferase n=1 Tax=unclassified Enterococcus TaxID=2608891 RepID=UPI003D2D0F82